MAGQFLDTIDIDLTALGLQKLMHIKYTVLHFYILGGVRIPTVKLKIQEMDIKLLLHSSYSFHGKRGNGKEIKVTFSGLINI